jgi:hypothetical protein
MHQVGFHYMDLSIMHGRQNIKHTFRSQISYMFRPNMDHHQAVHEEEKSNTYIVV